MALTAITQADAEAILNRHYIRGRYRDGDPACTLGDDVAARAEAKALWEADEIDALWTL